MPSERRSLTDKTEARRHLNEHVAIWLEGVALVLISRMTDPVREVVEVFPGQAFEHPILFDTGDTGRSQILSGAQVLTAKIKFSYGDQSQRRFVYLRMGSLLEDSST
jgi:hypothetical protein